MNIRLLIATPDDASLALLRSVVAATCDLICFTVTVADAQSYPALIHRVDEVLDDVILLDWEMVQAATADLVREILTHNPKMRIVVLLPSHQRGINLPVGPFTPFRARPHAGGSATAGAGVARFNGASVGRGAARGPRSAPHHPR